MGCCYRHPQTEVTEDPSVVMYTEVGFSVQFGFHGSRFPTLVSKDTFFEVLSHKGLAYVKDSVLFLESKITSNRLCCTLDKHCWKLPDIKQIEVVHGNITIARRQWCCITDQNIYNMNPGLRIFLKDTKIAMAMPAAQEFCAQLSQYCNFPSSSSGQIPQLQISFEKAVTDDNRSTATEVLEIESFQTLLIPGDYTL